MTGAGISAEHQQTTQVTLTVPHTLQEGKRYYVRAIGGVLTTEEYNTDSNWCQPYFGWGFTDGQNAAGFVHGEKHPDPVTEDVIKNVMGLR